MTDEQLGQIYHTARNAATFRDFKSVALDILSASIADTAGAKPDDISLVLRDAMATYPGSRETPDYAVRVAMAISATPAPSVGDAAGASESLPDNIDWTRVMALAEKHGDGWSEAKGWSFHCDDDLFNFAGELAKESGND